MGDLRQMIEARAARGAPRGVDAVFAAAERQASQPVAKASVPRRSWRVAALAGAVSITLVAVSLVWLSARSDPEAGRVTTEGGDEPGWAATPDAGIAGRSGAATATDGRRMFVWGGIGIREGSRSTLLADGALFDPVASAWEHVASAPAGFAGPGGAAVWDGNRFLVLAPADIDSPVGLAAYDPESRAWEVLAAPPLGARDGVSAVWTGTQLIAVGGVSGDRIATPFGATYDPASNSWAVLPEPPFPHYLPAAAVWDGAAVVFMGGASSVGGTSVDPQTSVPGAVYNPGTEEWVAVTQGPITRPAWAFPATGGINVIGESSTARFSRATGAWSDARPVDIPEDVRRVVAHGDGGWIAITDRGGSEFDGAELRALPEVDLSDRRTASVIVVGDQLVIWGGLRDTSVEDTALDTGLVIRLRHPVAPSPGPTPRPGDGPLSLDVDGDGAVDQLSVVRDGDLAVLQLTLAAGQTSTLPISDSSAAALLGAHILDGQVLIFYDSSGNTISNTRLATVANGALATVTYSSVDNAVTDTVSWLAHSNCCPLATVDVACLAVDGHDALVLTDSHLVRADGTEVTGMNIDEQPVSTYKRAWRRSIYRLRGRSLELVRTDNGVIGADAPDPAGVPLRNALRCGTANDPSEP
jgi:hypothetical protein